MHFLLPINKGRLQYLVYADLVSCRHLLFCPLCIVLAVLYYLILVCVLVFIFITLVPFVWVLSIFVVCLVMALSSVH